MTKSLVSQAIAPLKQRIIPIELSWTYLSPEHQRQGLGKELLTQLTNKLREQGARKLFVKVSDYQEDGEKLYDNAFHAYQAFGFSEELVNNDFYDEDENQHILCFSFAEHSDTPSDDELTTNIVDEKPIIRFCGLYEIAETDGAYSFEWGSERD